MQLDNTRIVVRERSFLEILDLALHVIRWRAGSLAVALAAGIVPFALLNVYLLSGLQEPVEDWSFSPGYLFYLVMLVLWEIPLATAPATLFLGQAVFERRPSARRVAGDFFRSLPQLTLYQVLLRGILLWLFIPWIWLFSQYVFLNEVILLERNPLRQRSPAKPSTERRCRALHGGVGGELFVRWMGAVALGGMVLLSLLGAIGFVEGLLVGRWEIENALFTHGFHAAMWLVVGFFTVVRFLSYLDVRIRREGWEVELIMRAESQRLAGPEAA
ncbi:MAG TPA: hypothetical protein VJL29_07150 [Thermoguttaceae bacterium]|nr:hypothetical protein [Thermoguttaceae bacterium]